MSGCKRQVPKNLKTATLEHDGQTREYHYRLPTNLKEQPPALVIALHGGGGKGARLDAMTNSQLTRAAQARKWVVVFPEGIDNGWNDGRTPVTRRDKARAKVDDIGFIGALIDRMIAEHQIDESRVYVLGMSNGGFMSFRVALELSDRVAAVAAVTASLGIVHIDANPKKPVGVLVMNGTKDPLIPYNGGMVKLFGVDRGEILSTEATVDWWAKRNNCRDTGDARHKPDTSQIDSTRVMVQKRSDCDDQVEVVLYKIEGGGHTWPRGIQYLPERAIGKVSHDIDAAADIFTFLSRHRRN